MIDMTKTVFSKVLREKTYGHCDMFLLSFKTSFVYTMIWFIDNLINALLPTFQIFIVAHFTDTAIMVYNKEAEMSAVFMSLGLLLSIRLYSAIMSFALGLLGSRRDIFYRCKLSLEMLERYASLKYRYIENSDTQNLIKRVCPVFHTAVWDMYDNLLRVLNCLIYVAGILITLSTQVWWVGICMLLAGVPLMYITSKGGKDYYEADRETTMFVRYSDYLSSLILKRDAFEERSVFGTTDDLNRKYFENWEHARRHKLKAHRNNFVRAKAGGIIVILYSVGAMMVLIPLVAGGRMSIGMFVGLLSALFGLANWMSWGVKWLLEELNGKREYLVDLTEFMSLEIQADAIEPSRMNMEFDLVEFKNVSFTYPGTTTQVLNGCSFIIEKSKHYAFVGTNGAGKTTITKLLTGLYDNYEGEILIDGRELRLLTQPQIRGLSSAVYQDFARYFISLYDNINLNDTSDSDNRNKVIEILAQVGLSEAVAKLKDGIDTPLGKVLEGGIDLSGGEWQRVAMARAVLSNAPLKILDEPTAALDPISEANVYRNFEQIAKGKTTLFISHRLGSTKLADNIFVLSEGKVVESGSHNALMAQNGIYAEMYNSQAKWYKAEVENLAGAEVSSHA